MNNAEIRRNLAAAYRIIANYGWDDLTYTHLSSIAEDRKSYFICPFGTQFSEITASSLLHVSLDGKIISGEEKQYNRTGYVIHGAIYKNRPEIKAIFHLHTIEGVAVSAIKKGLLPISQFAMHLYDRVAYHDYNSLALDENNHGNKIVKDLGTLKVMILRNHGTLTCGETIHEAMFYMYHLQRACEVQCKTTQQENDLIMIPESICKQAVHDLLSFEKDLGIRDWQSHIRMLDRTQCDYKE